MNINKNPIIITIIGIFVLSISLSGCAVMVGAAAGGVGSTVWLSGKLSEQVSVGYDRAIEVTRSALKSMDMEVLKEIRKDYIVQIKSRYFDGSTVWIDIRPITDSTSKIDVRVGVKGNKEASSDIIESIKKAL